MEDKYFLEILRKYQKGKASEEEKKFVEAYYKFFEMEPGIEDVPTNELDKQLETLFENEIGKKLELVEEKSFSRRIFSGPAKIFKLRLVKVAAAILIIVCSGWFFFKRSNSHKNIAVNHNTKVLPSVNNTEEIKPGGNMAILILANGSKINLDSIHGGNIAFQGNAKVVKLNNGEVAYKIAGKNTSKKEVYNVIATPMGGTYQLTLSDGTRVWLNAGSSLRFPIAFTGKERKVILKGEAYFQVVHNAEKPFKVLAGSINVDDLGTYFDVRAYNDEGAVTATLLQGAIKVTNGQQQGVVLKPGQEARLENNESSLHINKADTTATIAWKDGLFRFNHTNIQIIMREIARWYDVQVEYKTDKLEDKNFSGVISRYIKVEDILKRFELTGTIQFKIEGHKIIVKDK